jgi:two-component system response regulator (stage 0 sporulation protein A)
MRKLLIADGSETFMSTLLEQLKDIFEVACCSDGCDVIPILRRFNPDILLLDLMLPGCDGLTILESICAMKERPIVLVVSRIFGFYVQDSLERLGVCYAMQKPCDASIVSNRIKELARYPKSQLLPVAEEEETVRSMLRALGFSSKHLGYRCLVEAIRSIAETPNQLYTKELYPKVGESLGCSWRQVERDIRTAIDSAWESRDICVWQEFFPHRLTLKEKPTNSAVISTLGQLLKKSMTGHQRQSKKL